MDRHEATHYDKDNNVLFLSLVFAKNITMTTSETFDTTSNITFVSINNIIHRYPRKYYTNY